MHTKSLFKSRFAGLLLLVAALAGCTQAPLVAGGADKFGGPLVIEKQGSFFVGGRDVKSDTLSSSPARDPRGTVTVDQMYVHYQVPPQARRPALVLVHGCCLSGKTWETTPDGRMGWDEYFVRAGFPAYVIDQVARGRSALDTSAIASVKMGRLPGAQLPAVFATSHEQAWNIFRFGPAYPEVFEGQQFPLEAQAEFWKQMVPDWYAALPSPNPTVPALAELARQIPAPGAVMISHSQGGIYPFQAAMLDRRGMAGIVAIEPSVCPSANGPLEPFSAMPILFVFGDFTSQSRIWGPKVGECRAFAEAANRAGGRVEVLVLPEKGIRGNTHMMMQDRNSLQVAALIAQWIDTHVGPRR